VTLCHCKGALTFQELSSLSPLPTDTCFTVLHPSRSFLAPSTACRGRGTGHRGRAGQRENFAGIHISSNFAGIHIFPPTRPPPVCPSTCRPWTGDVFAKKLLEGEHSGSTSQHLPRPAGVEGQGTGGGRVGGKI